MARFVRTRRARQDLIEIWQHVAPNNPAAADALLDRIDQKCALLARNPRLGAERSDIRPGLRYALLARNPRLGAERSDIRPGLRYFVAGEYLILYRLIEDGIEVVRVVHGRRDLFNLA